MYALHAVLVMVMLKFMNPFFKYLRVNCHSYNIFSSTFTFIISKLHCHFNQFLKISMKNSDQFLSIHNQKKSNCILHIQKKKGQNYYNENINNKKKKI